jgi:hypothetical protein
MHNRGANEYTTAPNIRQHLVEDIKYMKLVTLQKKDRQNIGICLLHNSGYLRTVEKELFDFIGLHSPLSRFTCQLVPAWQTFVTTHYNRFSYLSSISLQTFAKESAIET